MVQLLNSINLNYQSLAGAVSWLLYIVYFAGLGLAFNGIAENMVRWVKLRKRFGDVSAKAKSKTVITIYINNLLSTSLPDPSRRKAFIYLEISVFVFVFGVGINSFSIFASIGLAFMIAALPVMLLLARLASERTKGSHEGISLLTELHRQYKLNNLNIFAAIEGCCSGNNNFPVLRKHLFNLLVRLRDSCGASESKAAADTFAFALGTVWGKMLSQCIYISAENGTDISMALMDITDQLKLAYDEEQEKYRLNSEASRMVAFMVPLLYAGSMLAAVYYLGMSPSKLFKNQFLTSQGFMFFILCVFLFMFNIIVLRVVSGSRLDF